MYVLGRQKQINMPSIWDGRQWSDVINGDTGNSLLLSHIFVIQFFFFYKESCLPVLNLDFLYIFDQKIQCLLCSHITFSLKLVVHEKVLLSS